MRLPWPQIALRWTCDGPSCTWPGSQPRRPAPQRAGIGALVPARYTPGTRQVHRRRRCQPCDSSNPVTPNSSARRRHPRTGAQGRVTPPTNARASRTHSARPAKCHGLPDRYPSHQRTAFPAARAPGKHGAAGRTHEDARPTRQRASSRNTPPAPPVRGRPWKTGGYTDRPGGPHAVRYASVDAQHSAQQRDKVTHHGIEKKRPANARIRS